MTESANSFIGHSLFSVEKVQLLWVAYYPNCRRMITFAARPGMKNQINTANSIHNLIAGTEFNLIKPPSLYKRLSGLSAGAPGCLGVMDGWMVPHWS